MMDKEEFIKYVEKTNERIREKLKGDGVALEFYSHLVVCFNRICNESQKQKEVIDKTIEKINDYKIYCKENKGFTEYTDIEIEAIEPVISKLEDILKEVGNKDDK